MEFHPLKVSGIRQETPDVTVLTLKPDMADFQKFRFTPGQFLMVRVQVNGKDERRAYSICNSQQDNFLRIAVKHIEGGVFSSHVTGKLKVDDVLWVNPPDGRFLGENTDLSVGEFVGIAAGSGITPILSVIRTVLEKSEESRFTLFYGNRTATSIAFRSELAGLKSTYMDRLRVYHVLSRESGASDLLNGRIEGERLEKLLSIFCPQPIDRVFVCGPETMMLESRDILLRRGIEESAIRIESFGNYDAKPLAGKDEQLKGSAVTIKLGGRTSTVTMGQTYSSILDAALDQGVELPFACRGGVCATCRCRVVSGSVVMDRNLALSQAELDDGMILSCRATSTSDEVELDFDI